MLRYVSRSVFLQVLGMRGRQAGRQANNIQASKQAGWLLSRPDRQDKWFLRKLVVELHRFAVPYNLEAYFVRLLVGFLAFKRSQIVKCLTWTFSTCWLVDRSFHFTWLALPCFLCGTIINVWICCVVACCRGKGNVFAFRFEGRKEKDVYTYSHRSHRFLRI